MNDIDVRCPDCDSFWVKCPCCDEDFCPDCGMTFREAEEIEEDEQ